MKINPVELKHQELKSLLIRQQSHGYAKSHSNISESTNQKSTNKQHTKNKQKSHKKDECYTSPDSGFGGQASIQNRNRNLKSSKSDSKKTLNSSSLNLSNSKTTPSESVDRYKHKSLIHKNSLGQSKGSQLDLVYLKPRATVRKKSAREIIFKILFLKYTSNLGVIT